MAKCQNYLSPNVNNLLTVNLFTVSCLEVKTNGTVKEEPAPVPETLRAVEKEVPAPVVTPQHAPPPPPPERCNEKEKEKVDNRDKTGGNNHSTYILYFCTKIL